MAKTKVIKGRVIRILDRNTIIVNLGKKDGVDGDNVFKILSEPEPVIDPMTKEELGKVNVVKAKLKSSLVEDKFTIATTKWRIPPSFAAGLSLQSLFSAQEVDQGELVVNKEDIKPWKAKTEIPVQVGDAVETTVEIPDAPELQDETGAKKS